MLNNTKQQIKSEKFTFMFKFWKLFDQIDFLYVLIENFSVCVLYRYISLPYYVLK